MTKAEKKRAIACLVLAIEYTGGSGVPLFTEKEYELMKQFLNEIQNELV